LGGKVETTAVELPKSTSVASLILNTNPVKSDLKQKLGLTCKIQMNVCFKTRQLVQYFINTNGGLRLKLSS